MIFRESGTKTLKALALYVPANYAALLNDVLNGTVVTVIWGPQGTTTGNPKITYNNVILTAYSLKNGQKGTIANDISGEAQTITQAHSKLFPYFFNKSKVFLKRSLVYKRGLNKKNVTMLSLRHPIDKQ
ncbi:MAG: hypothetical protein ACLQO7_10255 [Candidatus Bathyarchaeia archaeon]